MLRENLVEHLKVYSAYDEDGPLELVRNGKENDGGYVTAVKALKHADVLLGYGICNDNSFEDQFSLTYNKPSYGFDCGIDYISSKSKLFTFVKECISSDSFLYDKTNTDYETTSFEQQLDNLHLRGKNVFIKMDIEGAEYDAFSEILSHSKNITGIALEIHFSGIFRIKNALNLLKQLDKHFVLVHVHGNNCCVKRGFSTSNSIGKIPKVIELSYINKDLVTNYSLSKNQKHPIEIDQPNVKDSPDAVFEIIK